MERIEHYFQIRGSPPEEWLTAAKVAMEGQTLTWYHWWETSTVIHTWPRFREVVVKQFQPEEDGRTTIDRTCTAADYLSFVDETTGRYGCECSHRGGETRNGRPSVVGLRRGKRRSIVGGVVGGSRRNHGRTASSGSATHFH